MEVIKVVFTALLITQVSCNNKKHIVFIIADDMGWDDVSFHGSEEARTPNIDTLASSGVALERHYSHAICTPSRSALMTGKFSYKTGMQGYPLTFGEERALPLTEKIMPQYFKEQGYSTHLVGKWHLGSYKYAYLPTFRGFDTHYGHRGGFIDYYQYTSEQQWAPPVGNVFNVYSGFDLFRNVTTDLAAEGYITDIYTNEAIKLIKNHNLSQPLFLTVSHNAPHCGDVGATLQADPKDIRAKRYIENSERKIYCAMVKKFDDSVGDIIKALDDNNMLNNTIIAVIADNGGPTIGLAQNWGSNEPFRGAKATPWEGGLRTVGVLWSKELTKAKNVWNGYIHGVDWLPTFLEAIGAVTPKNIDGVSQWNNILNSKTSSRTQIVEIDDYSNYSAIIQDNYKLVRARNGTGFDNYYGSTFKGLTGSPPDYKKSVLKSKAYDVFRKWGLNIDAVLKLRKTEQIKCGSLVDSGCIPRGDCLHLQLYRDPRDRFKKNQTKASLSLQHFLGFESGFTLDKESNTIAIICQDVVVALAFETRERLIAWQVKVGSQLGISKEFLVMIGSGSKKLPAGPARLHLQGRKFAMTAGVPPRLLALWELKHLRRYGVVEGRFCFEGGSHCGKNEGLHVLITDQAHEITDAFDLALHGHPALGRPGGSRKSTGERGNNNRPDTRLSDFNNFDQSIPDTASGIYEENFFGADCGRISPLWSSDERRQSYEDFDARPIWDDSNHVTIERCSNCMMKLGDTTRTCAVSVTPTFNPAWKMDTVPDSSSSGNSSNSTEYLKSLRRDDDTCHCSDKPPLRPPKPYHLEPKKPPLPLPINSCSCADNENGCLGNNDKVGPYEDYDVPKVIHTEVPSNSEYYDTPKRIKKYLADDLLQATKEPSISDGPVVLKKTCGCVLKLASQKKALIVECEESLQPNECPCQKVTNWANNLIGLPYCKKTPTTNKVTTEVLEVVRDISDAKAIYATVDISRKTNRQSGSISEKDNILSLVSDDSILQNYENVEPLCQEESNICANYENLEFSLSLEHYENAKDLLKKAGVTQNELDALCSKIETPNTLPKKAKLCTKCVYCKSTKETGKKNKSDEYLLMGPNDSERDKCLHVKNLGYTPMCPNPNWSHSLKYPQCKTTNSTSEKYVSSPTLHSDNILSNPKSLEPDILANRTSPVESEIILDDLNEYDSSIASHVTSSSLETLRNMAIDVHHQESSSNEGASCTPPMRNKLMDNAQIKRSSSVPCKNRDSSSSNDSGVSSCSMKHQDFEAPITSTHSGHKYMVHKKLRGNVSGCLHSSLPRKSKSSDPLRDKMIQIHVQAKSSSAEAEVPVLPPKQLKGVLDTHSTSSGTSDMSDYFETLSISSSQSSDTQMNLRINRQPTNTLRPRSGKEYQNIDPVITSMYKSGKDLVNYTNLP